MFALAPRPNRKTQSSTLLIWAAKIRGVVPSWKWHPRHPNITNNTAHMSNTNSKSKSRDNLQLTPSWTSRLALKSHRVSALDKQPLTAAWRSYYYSAHSVPNERNRLYANSFSFIIWCHIVTCMMKRCPTDAVRGIYCQSLLHGRMETNGLISQPSELQY